MGEVTAFILAGGKSTRMGAEKAFVELNGQTLLARALGVARSVAADVRIVGDAAKFARFAPVVADVFRECGPLGGIHAALQASSTDLNLMLAVDLPFVSAALLQYLLSRANAEPNAIVTVVRTNEGWQPLCAVYRRAFAERAEEALRSSHYKIDALFDNATTQAIGAEELRLARFSPHAFVNLNSPEDIAAALEKVEK